MRILVVSRGVIGGDMAGPGNRAYHIAQVLAKEVPGAEVTLAVPRQVEQPQVPGVQIAPYTGFSALSLVSKHDIIISSGLMPQLVLNFRDKLFVADLFGQSFMEWLELITSESGGVKRMAWMNKNYAYIKMQLTLADFILCSNERQRDSYIGMMAGLGLVDPEMYDNDATLRRCIDVVPNGLRHEQMISDQKVLKGVYAGINEGDKVILWNGGMVSWYDPETFLRALHLLAKERNDIKALFLGTFYPGLGSFLGEGQMFEPAFQLSKDLGLYQRSVFFEFGWVPHAQVKNFLLESDMGICTYLDNLETRYSHRTSFLDLMWAELPIICTRGDVLAEMVAQRDLGVVVAEGDVAAVADAIRRLVDDKAFYEQCQKNLRAVKPDLSWEIALEPLIHFCREANPTSVAKRDRFLPLLSRSAEYLLSGFLDTVAPKQ